MSSWFDKWDREVKTIEEQDDDAQFLTSLAAIEAPRIKAIQLVVGDREFPPDLREKIMGCIAQWAIGGLAEGTKPTTKAREWVLMMRSSEVSSRLHTLFHEVGNRRHQTRYGLLDDNPRSILLRRDEHDGTDLLEEDGPVV